MCTVICGVYSNQAMIQTLVTKRSCYTEKETSVCSVDVAVVFLYGKTKMRVHQSSLHMELFGVQRGDHGPRCRSVTLPWGAALVHTAPSVRIGVLASCRVQWRGEWAKGEDGAVISRLNTKMNVSAVASRRLYRQYPGGWSWKVLQMFHLYRRSYWSIKTVAVW